MNEFPQGFSAREVEPSGGGQQFPVSPPEGWPVVITGSEIGPTTTDPNNGKLTLEMQIIEGENQGTVGTDNLNLFHSNTQACEIAGQQLSAYCWVTDKPDAKTAEELYNIPFRILVTQNTKAGQEQYVNIKPLHSDGSKPGKSTGQPVATAPVENAPTNTWQKKPETQAQEPTKAAPSWAKPK